MRWILTIPSLAALVPALIFDAPAIASDGVNEINQACAVQSGCFTGDSAGFPVTISAAGSYRLTSNLTIPNENTTGIRITVSSVAIDLGRFSIARTGCETSGIDCERLIGTGSGIESVGTSTSYIAVTGGTIVGMGTSGVSLGSFASIQELSVASCNSTAIKVGDHSMILRSRAANSGRGFFISSDSEISESHAYVNSLGGITGTGFSTILSNRVYNGIDHGILSGNNSKVTGNLVNGEYLGISAGDGSEVSNNVIYDGRHGTGIQVGEGTSVTGNTLRENYRGMDLGATSTYHGNTITTSRTVEQAFIQGGVDLGGNYCSTPTPACP